MGMSESKPVYDRSMCRSGLDALLVLLLPGLGGCGFLESATARVVVAGLVVKGPAIELAGQYSVPGETVATVWLGMRASGTSTEEPAPISGADVTLAFDGNRVVLAEQSERGLYLASSTEDQALVYSTRPYTFVAHIGQDSADYGGSVTPPTELSAAAIQLAPTPTESVPGFPDVQRHPKSTALDVSWQPQFGRYGYVTVFRAQKNDPEHPVQVFDNRPKTALETLQLIAGDPPVKITVPADAFAVDGVYAVVLVAIESGEVLPSTFIGSPELAGSGAVRILAVGDVNL